MTFDDRSLLIEVDGSTTLASIEVELAGRGVTLGVDGSALAMTVADWIARGLPGAPSAFGDPADHVVAGLTGTLGGRTLAIRPAPRRAVGPDLIALFAGTGDRLGRVTRAWLRVHRRDAVRPALPLPGVALDPPLSAAESRLVDAIRAELSAAGGDGAPEERL